MYPHGLCAPVYSKRAETLPLLLLLLLLCVCVCVCVCHWLSELRHVRSHAHKEKKEKSPQSGTVYTPISQYTHTHNNIRRSSRTGGELREQVTSAQNGFLSSSSSMSYQFLQFRRRKKSTFPFLLSLSLCGTRSGCEGKPTDRRRRGRFFFSCRNNPILPQFTSFFFLYAIAHTERGG